MSNFEVLEIYQKVPNKSKLTIKDINGVFNKAPVVYIESDIKLEINGIHLSIDGNKFDLTNLKIFEIVQLLNNNGVNAKISNPQYFMYPACLLDDFNSETIRTELIRVSPKDLFEYGISYPEAIYDINDSVSFEIIDIYDDTSSYNGNIENFKVYAQVGDTTKIMYKEVYSKYFLNALSSKAINSHNLSSTESVISLYTIAKASNNDI